MVNEKVGIPVGKKSLSNGRKAVWYRICLTNWRSPLWLKVRVIDGDHGNPKELSISILGLFICVIYPCMTDYMICALKSSLEIWLWLNWWYPRWSWVNPFHFCSLYRIWFCFSVSLQMTGFHFYPNSCPLRNIYLHFQGDYSSFYIWALEQQNRKPKVLVSNSSWASRSLAHHRCPVWILIWHARFFL